MSATADDLARSTAQWMNAIASDFDADRGGWLSRALLMPNCEVTVTVQLRACTCTLAADFGGTSIELACERVGGLILRPPVSAGHNLGIPKFAQDG